MTPSARACEGVGRHVALSLAVAVLIAGSSCRAAAAQSLATITASPNPVPAGAGDGKTTVSWTTGDDSSAEVYVSVNGAREVLFAGARARGGQLAPWIGAGETYEFRLYAGTSHAQRLAAVVVTRAAVGSLAGINATDPPRATLDAPLVPADAASSGAQHTGAIGLWPFAALLGVCTGVVTLAVGGRQRWRWPAGRIAASSNAGGGVRSAMRPRWLLWLWVTTAVFLIANQALVRGAGVGLWDAEGLFYPYQVLVADHARAGRFVSWDPWSSGGLPASGEPQVGAYSPIAVAVGLLFGGTSAGFMAYWLFLWWLGGFGIFMLGRSLGASPWGACVVALGFLFCGVYTGQAEHVPLTAAFSFLPLIVWRVEAAFAAKSSARAAEAGALWGLSALAGYPGVVIITGGLAVVWMLGLWLCRDDRRPGDTGALDTSATERLPFRFLLTALILFAGVGLTVLSPTYAAFFLDGAGSHTRVGVLSRDVALLENALHPGALSTFASPYLAMLKFWHLEDLWFYTDISMASIYTGASMPILALLALASRPRDKWRWWVLAVAVLSLACALAQTLPLRGWLYDWIYPTRFFRHAAIFRYYFIFSIAVLALLATRDLSEAFARPADRIRSRLVIAAGTTAALAAVTFLSVTSFVPNPRGPVLGAYLHVVLVWGGALCLAVLAFRQKRPVLRSMAMLFPLLASSDALMTAAVSKDTIVNTGGHPLAPSPDHWRTLDRTHDSHIRVSQGLFRRESSCLDRGCEFLVNDQMITKRAVFNAYSPQENRFHKDIAADDVLRQMAVGNDRIWFAQEATLVAPTAENFAALRDRARAAGTAPLLVHSPEAMLRLGLTRGVEDNQPAPERIARLPAAQRLPAQVLRYEPADLVLRVQAPSDGWLLVTDRWARGWRADINGKPAAVFGGNFIFRAVEIPAGDNEVRFRYRASGFPWLLIASWATLALVGARAMARESRARLKS